MMVEDIGVSLRAGTAATIGREDTMKVTIIGAGNMARGIGTRLLSGGVDLQILAPDAGEATSLSQDLAGGGGSVAVGSAADPIEGDVVVLATPYDGAIDVVTTRAGDLAGKIVVDITNPVDWSTMDSLVVPEGSSAAQEIAMHLGEGSRVVKAFNTTFAGTLVAGQVADQQLDVLLAGDDEDAKAVVRGMVEAAGMRAVDIGPLRRARQLEELGFLHISIQDKLGTGYGSAVKLIMP